MQNAELGDGLLSAFCILHSAFVDSNMLLNYEDLSPVKKSVEVEIPADLISNEAKRVTTEFTRQAKLPGFRPGKVPPSVVRTRFAKEIQDEVMNRLLSRSFRDAISEKGVEPVGDPQLQHIDPFIEGAPVKYKAEFEVKPRIELREYRGIEIDEPKIEVSDEDVDKMIERLRDQASSYRVENDRLLQNDDFAMIDITTSGEGLESETRSGHFRVGEETPMPELHDALRGKKPGESGSFDKTYGEDASNEKFHGKSIHHEVTLKEIRVQEKPDINDEFAKSVGGWESVQQMRETIAADIRKHREFEALRVKQNQIGEHLLGIHDFEVPDALVEEELGKSLQNYARFLASQGVDVEKAELDWNKVAEDFRPEAVKRVKRSLILEAIAKKENIEGSDVEVDAESRRAANESGRDVAEVKYRLRQDGGYEALRASLAQEKALALVLKEATTREPDNSTT
ncbi:MAG: trigger factor [Acidobacteria bacterium]|nr:MAG: trigger factor [Acidobacteriota bacterium]